MNRHVFHMLTYHPISVMRCFTVLNSFLYWHNNFLLDAWHCKFYLLKNDYLCIPTNIFEFGSGVQVNYMEKFNPVGSCFQFCEVGLEQQVVSGYCAVLLRQTLSECFRGPMSYEVFYSVWNRTCYPLDGHLVCYPLDEHLPTLAPESVSSDSFEWFFPLSPWCPQMHVWISAQQHASGGFVPSKVLFNLVLFCEG